MPSASPLAVFQIPQELTVSPRLRLDSQETYAHRLLIML